MILLFNGMQGSLSMVYDREMGSMRVLLTSPLPRTFLLCSKLLATALISLLQVYAFLAIAWLYGVQPPLGPAARPAGRAAGGLDAQRPGAAAVKRDPPTGELCRGDELRDLPAVLLVGAVPAVEDARGQPSGCTGCAQSTPSPMPWSWCASPCMSASPAWPWRCAWA
jgi:hypothetical protein